MARRINLYSRDAFPNVLNQRSTEFTIALSQIREDKVKNSSDEALLNLIMRDWKLRLLTISKDQIKVEGQSNGIFFYSVPYEGNLDLLEYPPGFSWIQAHIPVSESNGKLIFEYNQMPIDRADTLVEQHVGTLATIAESNSRLALAQNDEFEKRARAHVAQLRELLKSHEVELNKSRFKKP